MPPSESGGPSSRRGGRTTIGLLGQPCQHPQQVGQAVEVGHQPGARYQTFVIEGDDAAFSTADHRAADLQRGRQPVGAGNDELPGHLYACFGITEHRLEHAQHRLIDTRLAITEPIPGVRIGGQLRACHEEVALQLEQGVTEVRDEARKRGSRRQLGDLGTRQTEAGNGLIDGAVGLGAGIVLGDTTAVEQASGAVIAFARGNSAAGERRDVARDPRIGIDAMRLAVPATRSGRRHADPSARPAR